MKFDYSEIKKSWQFLISITVVVAVSVICYLIKDYIGYRSVALILLFCDSIIAIFFSLYPVLLAAILSAIIWDYFFIPPMFTMHIGSAEDVLMLFMFFVIVLLNGTLTSKIRQFEKVNRIKEEKLNAIKLYRTVFDSISHELRTPISAIYASIDNLQFNQNNLTQTDILSLHEEIRIAVNRLDRNVDNLLNMSRLESGFIKPNLHWCSIEDIIKDVINRLNEEISGHRIEVKINDDTPIFKLDEEFIKFALFNIVHNACMHTPEESSIKIQVNSKNSILQITISDNGDGFSSEEVNRIFDKFYRIKGTKSGGSGLGLSIAKGFVEAHHGTIKAISNKSEGAIFIIEIPCETSTFEKLERIENDAKSDNSGN